MQAKKIRWQTDKQASKVILSLFELLVISKENSAFCYVLGTLWYKFRVLTEGTLKKKIFWLIKGLSYFRRPNFETKKPKHLFSKALVLIPHNRHIELARAVVSRFVPHFSIAPFSHRKSAHIKKLAKVDGRSLWVYTFPDPVSHFGAPWQLFWILQAVRFCRQCGVAGGERVPPSPLGWYFS